jgi:hypothetical protein
VSRGSLAEEKGGAGENLWLNGGRCFLKGAAAWIIGVGGVRYGWLSTRWEEVEVWPRPAGGAPASGGPTPKGARDVRAAAWLRRVQGRRGQTRCLYQFYSIQNISN